MATLTETLSNGLKSLFSGLGAKTTNTTNGGVPLLNTSTGEPNGMMSMANFGGQMSNYIFGNGCAPISSNTDLNSISVPGAYRCNSASTAATLTNCPSTGAAFNMFVISPYNGEYPSYTPGIAVQIIVDMSGKIYKRQKESGEWTNWAQVQFA
jgi:hypothetical protein